MINLTFYLSVNDKAVTVGNESHIHMTFLTGCCQNKILKLRHEIVSYHMCCELLTVLPNKQLIKTSGNFIINVALNIFMIFFFFWFHSE